MYNTVKVEKGRSGWGGPLYIKPEGKRNKIVCVTGQDMHPVAYKLAQMTNAELVNGFATGVPDAEIAAVVIDCGGTARCGVYPKKGILTINVKSVGQSGPLAKFMTEQLYVSDVNESCISIHEGNSPVSSAPEVEKAKTNIPDDKAKKSVAAAVEAAPKKKENFIVRLGKGVGDVIGKFYEAGRETIDSIIKNILPFMAFVCMIIGIINKTGIGNIIAKAISPAAGSLVGLIIVSIICTLPILSPILGPGAVVAQVVGVLVGTEIGKGHIPPHFALPALFAIDAQVGCDFIPVGLSLAEAEPETVEVGVPAVLFSRVVTGPLSVIIAYFVGVGLYE
ncbi:MAG: PTS glucitol/sorbitol transporter subunit IIB [Clostridium sp.]|jgi:PTS system glucitol/sorbitol-specific IIC component|uniref:PTS glucitol/sorbitol transporter subunit IIB n=1 Tax=Clostridium sp. TaxID=1506 RepID=UPI0025C1729C|nr:PTS glucitol/sorbitol transporter subunit IIB [Clostridium sp.]MCH3965783.1 PTS glucitol/sorbitol transporter subunit IIB [Clostridium sp.]